MELKNLIITEIQALSVVHEFIRCQQVIILRLYHHLLLGVILKFCRYILGSHISRFTPVKVVYTNQYVTESHATRFRRRWIIYRPVYRERRRNFEYIVISIGVTSMCSLCLSSWNVSYRTYPDFMLLETGVGLALAWRWISCIWDIKEVPAFFV